MEQGQDLGRAATDILVRVPRRTAKLKSSITRKPPKCLLTASKDRMEAAALIRRSEIKAEVAGHTDNRGAAQYNRILSQRRAETVRSYLVSKGVDPARLTARGYGPDAPIADNGTQSGRAANRRVELRRVD